MGGSGGVFLRATPFWINFLFDLKDIHKLEWTIFAIDDTSSLKLLLMRLSHDHIVDGPDDSLLKRLSHDHLVDGLDP